MSKEHGQLFLAVNEEIPLDGFVLNTCDIEIHPGDDVKIECLHPILVTLSADLAEKYIAIGIIRRECVKGRDCLLMTSPEAEVVMK